MMRRAYDRSALLVTLGTGQRFARIVIVVRVSRVDRDHSRRIAGMGERKVVGTPFDKHHK